MKLLFLDNSQHPIPQPPTPTPPPLPQEYSPVIKVCQTALIIVLPFNFHLYTHIKSWVVGHILTILM